MNVFRSTTTTPIVTVSMDHSPERRVFLLIPFVLICFALSPAAQAVSPAPDGGYSGNNTAEGDNALLNLISGGLDNTAIGFDALESNTAGRYNTATGSQALLSITDGVENTAVGAGALESITGFFPSDNTAVGAFALESNLSGSNNTAVGADALLSSTTSNNTATGYRALWLNTTGSNNTALGFRALGADIAATITGSNNTATGAQASFSNTTGSNNTATGAQAIFNNTSGNDNDAHGYLALHDNTTGSGDAAFGFKALFSNTTGNFNTAEGFNALQNNSTGTLNTALGANAGSSLTTGGGNVCIGASVFGVAGESNTTRIRNVYASVASARAVYVNSDNKIGVLSSSRRYKDEIKPMDKASETLFALKPVTFRYKKEVDPARMLSFGLISEEVAKINPDLITRDDEGKPQTVRYEAVNAMLLNEFLKEHKTVHEQGASIARLQKQVEVLTEALQKVSAQLELSKAAPQTVLNNQ